MIKYLRSIAENEFLQSCILFLILVNAGLLWMATYQWVQDTYGDLIDAILSISQWVFIVEILIRVIAFSPNYKQFFSEFSNVFDFTIVAISLIPIVWPFAFVARILRIFRALRIFSVSDTLREYIAQIKTSLRWIFSSIVLYIVLNYIFSVLWFYLFSDFSADWKNLHKCINEVFLLSIFSDAWNMRWILELQFWYIFYFGSLYISFGILYMHTLAAIISKYSQKK